MSYIIYSIWYDTRIVVLCIWILSNFVFAYYAKRTGENLWYLGLLPVINMYLVRKMSSCNLFLLLLYSHTLIIYLLRSPDLLILQFLLGLLINFKFAKVCLNVSSPVIFTFVPFAKYIIMIKEANQCESIIKATPIWNTKKMKD